MRRPRSRGWLLNLVLAAVVVAVVGGAYLSLGGSGQADASVQTATVTRGTVQETVSASGTVASARSVAVNFSGSGTVKSIAAHLGRHVKAGQVLARLDDTAARRQLAADTVNLRSARASLENTEDNLGCSVAADCSTSGAVQLLSAKASLASARLQVQQDLETLAGTRLTAPISGTVVSLDGTVGDTEPAADTSTDFLVVADLSHLEVTANFSETDAAKLKVGQSATVTLDALPNTQVDATVVRIDRTSTVVNNVVTYEVTLRLRGHPAGIRLGQSASVTVVTAEAQDVLTVPSAVVQTAGGRSVVTVLRAGNQVQVPVQVGLEGDQTTEIRSGLAENEQVVIPTSSSGTGFPSEGFPGGGVLQVGGPGPGGP